MSRKLQLQTKKEYKIIGSDYSAQEPRLTAHYSQDSTMIQAYKEGKDLYAVIAQGMFNNDYYDNLEFYPEGKKIVFEGKEIICGNKTHKNKDGAARRSQAKTVLLGMLYGRGAKSIGEQLGKGVKEGQEIIDKFFKKFPTVEKWISATNINAKKDGYVEDWYGRRRHLPDLQLNPYEVSYINSSDQSLEFNPFINCENRVIEDTKLKMYQKKCSKVRYNKDFLEIKEKAKKDGISIIANSNKIAQAERQCVNARVQGGAATLTKLAMINIYNDPILNSYGFKLLITVHDEVLGECPEEYAEKASDRLVQVMIDSAKEYIDVPMKCDPYIVSHWYEDEYAVVVQKEYQNLIDSGKTEQEAYELVKENHPETLENELNTILTEI